MSWLKPEEKHYTVNRRTRDRKGGHSPKILINDDGVVFVTPPQKREEKRRVTRNRRKEANRLAKELVEEFLDGLKQDAIELEHDLESMIEIYSDAEMCSGWDGYDDDFDHHDEPDSPYDDNDYYERWGDEWIDEPWY